jgi:hypothetical protein
MGRVRDRADVGHRGTQLTGSGVGSAKPATRRRGSRSGSSREHECGSRSTGREAPALRQSRTPDCSVVAFAVARRSAGARGKAIVLRPLADARSRPNRGRLVCSPRCRRAHGLGDYARSWFRQRQAPNPGWVRHGEPAAPHRPSPAAGRTRADGCPASWSISTSTGRVWAAVVGSSLVPGLRM